MLQCVRINPVIFIESVPNFLWFLSVRPIKIFDLFCTKTYKYHFNIFSVSWEHSREKNLSWLEKWLQREKMGIFWLCDSAAVIFKSLAFGYLDVFACSASAFHWAWWSFCCSFSLYCKCLVSLMGIPVVHPQVPVRICCLVTLGCCHSRHGHPTVFWPTPRRINQASLLQVR